MRALVVATVLAAAALWAPEAHAQFANRSLGLSAGYISLAQTDVGIDQGIPISLDASLYIENGFDFVVTFPLMILRDTADPAFPGGRQVIGVAPSSGIRYLFSEESVRPYLEADISYLHVFRETGTSDFVGIGPAAGIDIFTGDTVSIGARVMYTAYLSLNAPVQSSFGGLVGLKTYF